MQSINNEIKQRTLLENKTNYDIIKINGIDHMSYGLLLHAYILLYFVNIIFIQ